MNHERQDTTEVVLLNRYRATMHHQAIKQIEAYWEGLRADRPVPLRAEVDPRAISKALEYAFILERIAPGLARFRLAGMHLNDLMGMEVRGMPVTSFFVPDARARISDALEHVFEEPARARLRMTGAPGLGKPALNASMVLLPLKSDLGDISRALGCFVTDGEAGRTPRRFAIESCEVISVLDGSSSEFDDSEPELAEGFAEAPAAFEPPKRELPESPFKDAPVAEPKAEPEKDEGRSNSERPYLKLIHSSD